MKKQAKIWDIVKYKDSKWKYTKVVWTNKKWELILIDMPSRIY